MWASLNGTFLLKLCCHVGGHSGNFSQPNDKSRPMRIYQITTKMASNANATFVFSQALHFFHKSQQRAANVNRSCRSRRAVQKYPHVRLKTRAEPVGFPGLLIISIYSHPAYCGHQCLHLMMPHLVTGIDALVLSHQECAAVIVCG